MTKEQRYKRNNREAGLCESCTKRRTVNPRTGKLSKRFCPEHLVKHAMYQQDFKKRHKLVVV